VNRRIIEGLRLIDPRDNWFGLPSSLSAGRVALWASLWRLESAAVFQTGAFSMATCPAVRVAPRRAAVRCPRSRTRASSRKPWSSNELQWWLPPRKTVAFWLDLGRQRPSGSGPALERCKGQLQGQSWGQLGSA